MNETDEVDYFSNMLKLVSAGRPAGTYLLKN